MEKLSISLVWDNDDFKPLEGRASLPEDEATLSIDEGSEKIILRIPEGKGLVARRTIQRRVQSIRRSGLQVSGGLRIGAGFPIDEETPEEKLSETLLQAGHGYVADVQIAAQRAGEIPGLEERQVAPQAEPEPTTTPSVTITPSVSPTTALPESKPSEIDVSNRDLVTVGIFAASLLETLSELFVSKDSEDQYSLDFGSGNVIRFKVQNGEIKDLSTLGISEDDSMIQKALNTIKAHLSK